MDVPRETRERLDIFVAAMLEESKRHNLIARSTVEDAEERHIVDSFQLLRFVPAKPGHWIDIGTGAGFPGMVIAIAAPDWTVTMVEPRSLRADFLRRVASDLALGDRVTVAASKIEHVQASADVISARAVARLDALFGMAAHLATPATRWLLPKGRQAAAEVAEARRGWTGDIRLEPSATSPEAAIVVADHIRRKERRR